MKSLRTIATTVMAGGPPAAGAASESLPPPSLPPLAAQGGSALESFVAFAGDGCGLADEATVRRRLETCSSCDRLRGDRCAACGCFIRLKARGRAFRCPLSRWPQ